MSDRFDSSWFGAVKKLSLKGTKMLRYLRFLDEGKYL